MDRLFHLSFMECVTMKSKLFVSLIAVMIFNVQLAPNITHAGFGEWQLRNPSELSIHIQSLAYGNGQYVAFSIGGLVYSSDLVKWEQSTSRTMSPIDKIKFLNYTFYALPNGGPLLSSVDGIAWQEEPVLSQKLYDIAFGMGILIAVGDEGIFVLEQGSVWNRIENLNITGLKGIAYGNNVFIAIGDGGIVLTSRNGRDWASVDLKLKYNFNTIAFGNGMFVAAGRLETVDGSTTYVGPYKILISTNGVSWSEQTECDGYMNSIFWKDGYFWGVSASTIFYSNDGINWKTSSLGAKVRFEELYDGGSILIGKNYGGLYTSDDGKKWKAVVSAITDIRLNDITYAKGLFVAVGSGDVILTSSDGQKWEKQYLKRGDSFQAVLYITGKFFAIGTNSIFSSPDGIKWVQEPDPADGGIPLRAAKGKEALIIGCFHGKILRSTDTKTWTAIETGIDEPIKAVTYGSGIFIAVTQNHVILRSVDEGITWEIQEFEKSLAQHIAYGNGIFLLAALEKGYYEQHFYSSADGETWQKIQTEDAPARILSVRYIKDSFVVTDYGKIYSSPDGHKWVGSDMKDISDINSIAYGNGSYVAVGERGMIMQAEAR